MKRTLCMLLVVALVPAVVGADEKKGELTDPLEILKKLDAAAKAVKVVKYDVVFEGLDAEAARLPKLEATMIFQGYAYNQPEKSFIDAKITAPGSADVQHVTAGGDGETYFLIDHQTKIAYEDIDPQVVGSFGRVLPAGVMIEFVHETPFNDEIIGKVKELRGSKVINGVDCYEVYVVYANDAKAVWFISKKDFLPRRRIDEYTGRDGSVVRRQRTLANLVVDPKLGPDAYKLKLPEGFTKTDDFAP